MGVLVTVTVVVGDGVLDDVGLLVDVCDVVAESLDVGNAVRVSLAVTLGVPLLDGVLDAVWEFEGVCDPVEDGVAVAARKQWSLPSTTDS